MNTTFLVKVFNLYNTFGGWTWLVVLGIMILIMGGLKEAPVKTVIIIILVIAGLYWYEPIWFKNPGCGVSEDDYLRSFEVVDTIKLFK